MQLNCVDRGRVRRAFHRQAGSYDEHTRVQKRVVSRFVQLLAHKSLAPASFLDVGTGTGMLSRGLSGLYPDAAACGIDLAFNMCRTAQQPTWTLNADAEKLPFRAKVFDLVVSTSVFQWLGQPDEAFAEACRVIKPGGWFCFAMFGGDTLHELRSSYRAALAGSASVTGDPTHRFFSPREVSDALARAGFAVPEVFSEHETDLYPDVKELLFALKGIGAGNASPDRGLGLARRSVMLRMMEIYQERFGVDGEIPATYEVIYAFCRKGPC
ncbi:MAG: methyltransferase domain-containing protein [Geobacter sp.]|nr:methyltransferase domain-containing protein [Geobacter sp.]